MWYMVWSEKHNFKPQSTGKVEKQSFNHAIACVSYPKVYVGYMHVQLKLIELLIHLTHKPDMIQA